MKKVKKPKSRKISARVPTDLYERVEKKMNRLEWEVTDAVNEGLLMWVNEVR